MCFDLKRLHKQKQVGLLNTNINHCCQKEQWDKNFSSDSSLDIQAGECLSPCGKHTLDSFDDFVHAKSDAVVVGGGQ